VACKFALVVLAAIFGSWRALAAASAVVCAAFLALWPLVPESARWQLVRGDKEAATAGAGRGQPPTCRCLSSQRGQHAGLEAGAA
jgi:hypothetical protein